MLKRILAITLCLIIISAIAVTGAVSAKKDDKAINTAIRQIDIIMYRLDDATGEWIAVTYGKITINSETGHYDVNMNYAKIGLKDQVKERFREQPYVYSFLIRNLDTMNGVIIYGIALTNNGGNIHGEGTIDPTEVDLARIAGWDNVAAFPIGQPAP
jgi:hypothetical protein